MVIRLLLIVAAAILAVYAVSGGWPGVAGVVAGVAAVTVFIIDPDRGS